MAEKDDPQIGQDARDDSSAAKLVADTGRQARPGGGGLGGASAASDPLDQSGSAQGAGPSAPVELNTPHPEGAQSEIGHEAAQRAGGDAPEEKPASR